MKLPPFILASASPRRAELVKELGIAFKVESADNEELHPSHLTPHEICQVNAYRKARAVAKRKPDAVVLGADTIVVLGKEIFGKPRDGAEARRMLARLQGQTHQVITGVCLIQLREHRQKLFAVSTSVAFRPLTTGQIQDYLASINPLDKAGAYAIQENGGAIIEEITGSRSNVVGLPLERLREELRDWGFRC
ncbi:MAG: Maf family protein [Verrucomicrobia subdivision 3 bacterium]|nr:Maf family protein [Limisphaerales bacterium]